MIKVGIAGIGFMGWIHWLAWHRVPGVEVIAIATVEPERREGDWTAIKGNFGPPGERVDLSNQRVFESAEQMVAECNDLDLVDICLPTRFHPMAIEAGLKAGIHVMSEKPFALTLAECDRLLNLSSDSGSQLFVGHVLPFFPEYNWALEQIESGRFGKLMGGNFKRVISDPVWMKSFYDPGVFGGPLLDLHVHDAHLIRLLFGKPTAVSSRGRLRENTVSYAATVFDFDDADLVVSSTMGVIDQQGRPFTHGFEIHLEQATIHFESASFADGAENMPVKLLNSAGSVIRPTLGSSDPIEGFVGELTEVANCAANNRSSKILSGALARDAIMICEMQSTAIRKRSGKSGKTG